MTFEMPLTETGVWLHVVFLLVSLIRAKNFKRCVVLQVLIEPEMFI